MSKKIKLGNDFDEESEEADTSKEEGKETSEDESTEEEEKENSEESSEEKKPDEEKESEEESKSEEDKESETEEEEEEDDETKKKRELKGLENTEKDIDGDISELDEKIVSTKSRIVDKRGDRREKRDLIDKIDNKIPSEEKDEDDLSDIDEQTLGILDRYTKHKGLVPKSELEKMNRQTVHENAEEAFFKKHPEYDAANDKDDTLYKAIKEELSYFAAPTDLKKIPKLFEKAHNEVVKRYPDQFKKLDTSKQAVKKERIKQSGLGAGSSSGGGSESSSDKPKKEFSDVQKQALRDGGWTEDEITKLTS